MQEDDGRTKVVVLYGSQGGQALECAKSLVRQLRGVPLFSVRLSSCDEFDYRAQLAEQALVIAVMATFGEGDPTDDAESFWSWIADTACLCDLAEHGTKFAVFGCGNSTYEFYNAVAKRVDTRLEELGGQRVCDVGLGDDHGCLEDDFVAWRNTFTRALVDKMGLDESTIGDPDVDRDYVTIFPKGDDVPARDSPALVRPVKVDRHHAYPARVRCWKELHNTDKSGRSCIGVVFDTDGHRDLKYAAGDHLGIVPRNSPDLIDEVLELLPCSGDVFVQLKPVGATEGTDSDEHNRDQRTVQTLFTGCPVTLRNALARYVDISSVISKKMLKVLASYAPDDAQDEKERLLNMGRYETPEGKQQFKEMIEDRCAILADVLATHPKAAKCVDVGHLLEALPRLQPRSYSISTSAKLLDGGVGVTFVLSEYVNPHTKRHLMGVCTSWLRNMLLESHTDKTQENIVDAPLGEEQQDEGSTLDDTSLVPIFVRHSQFRLPRHLQTPVIMIGPGTGLAPFMSFISDRAADKANPRRAKKQFGATHLYFGCRHPDHDYLYQAELEEWKDKGILTSLRVAFSRAQKKKVYVQHLLLEDAETIAHLICDLRAHVYICGDGQRMSHDVQAALVTILSGHASVGTEAAAKTVLEKMHSTKQLATDVW